MEGRNGEGIYLLAHLCLLFPRDQSSLHVELTHLHLPIASSGSHWENQVPHPLVVFELGEWWEEAKSPGNGNYISILKTLAFMSWFLRKLMLEAIASNKTSRADTASCLPQIPSTNDWFILQGHRPPYIPAYPLLPHISQWWLQATAGETQ